MPRPQAIEGVENIRIEIPVRIVVGHRASGLGPLPHEKDVASGREHDDANGDETTGATPKTGS
jgi:hypothetical protein